VLDTDPGLGRRPRHGLLLAKRDAGGLSPDRSLYRLHAPPFQDV